MKTLWALSALILFIGVCVLAYSFYPETVSQPYMTWRTTQHDTMLKDGTTKALITYYSLFQSFNAGDRISIRASSSDAVTFSASITESGLTTKQSQTNVTRVNLDYTFPSSAFYQVTVSRYRASIFTSILTQTTANIQVTSHTSETVPVQAYRDVTTYPHKDLQNFAIAIMIAGIGAGVLSVAQSTRKNQPLPQTYQYSQIPPSPTYETKTQLSDSVIIAENL